MTKLQADAKGVADKLLQVEDEDTDSTMYEADKKDHRNLMNEDWVTEFKVRASELESQANDINQRVANTFRVEKEPPKPPSSSSGSDTVLLTQTEWELEKKLTHFETITSFAEAQCREVERASHLSENRIMDLEAKCLLLEQPVPCDESPAESSSERLRVLLEENEDKTTALVHEINLECFKCEVDCKQECQTLRKQLAEDDLKLAEGDSVLSKSISREQFDLIRMRHDNLECTASLVDKRFIGLEDESAKMKHQLDLEVARTNTTESAMKALKAHTERANDSLERAEAHINARREDGMFFKVRADASERAVTELEARLEKQKELAQESSEALEACTSEFLVLEASEAKAQDSVAWLEARLRESIHAQEAIRAMVASTALDEASEYLDEKTQEQMALHLELQEETIRNEGVEKQLQTYEEHMYWESHVSCDLREVAQELEAELSRKEAIKTRLKAETEDLIAERVELTTQLQTLEEIVQEQTSPGPPQQVIPLAWPVQGQVAHVWSVPLTLPVQKHQGHTLSISSVSSPLVPSPKIGHEVVIAQPADNNVFMSLSGESFSRGERATVVSPLHLRSTPRSQSLIKGSYVEKGRSSPTIFSWRSASPGAASPILNTKRVNFPIRSSITPSNGVAKAYPTYGSLGPGEARTVQDPFQFRQSLGQHAQQSLTSHAI